MIISFTWIYIISRCFSGHDAANILGIGWFPATSHQATFQPVWRELSLRGHEVTAIATVPIHNSTLRNLTEINISNLFEIARKRDIGKIYSRENWLWNIMLYSRYLMEEFLEEMLNNVEVKELIASNKHFDVIIAESHHPLVYAFAERFKAPLIALTSVNVGNEVHDIYGNPTHPLISPDMRMPLDPSPKNHPLLTSFKSLSFNIWGRMLYYWYILPRADGIAKKHFGDNFPHLTEIIEKYSSILLMNVNSVINPVRPNVPAVIEINQIHIRQNRSLPKDIQDFLDSSENGAVYFSMGTNMPSTGLDNRTVNEIVNAFAQLPFNVLWKWEKDIHPPVSSNVLIKKFFPQQDLLAHTNIKVFVTQGGMQSIEEAIFKEVPMVGIPFIADQPFNVKRIVELGIAEELEPSELTRESLKKAILEVASNRRYKQKIREFKSILEDQPMRGVEKVIWWIEHVIRHKGAKHLKSAAAEMSFYQYFLLDVIAVSLVVVSVILFVLYKFAILLRLMFRQKSKKD